MGFRRHALVGVISVVCFMNWAGTTWSETSLKLQRDDVVVFLGGADMVHLQQAGHLEAMLTRAFASQQPQFRDLAWEADTVFRQGTVIERWRQDGHGDLDGFGDLEQQLRGLKATVVIAQFGRVSAMAGDAGLAAWAAGYRQLTERLRRCTRQLVLVSPVPFEKPESDLLPDLSRYNTGLGRYVQTMRTIAESQGALFVDLFAEAAPGMTENGMHIKPQAQRVVAERIARQLGVAVPPAQELEALRLAVIEKHRLWYDYWRPANWKLLYGDDARRQFTRGGKDYIPFKEEWRQLVPLVAKAEDRVRRIAAGGEDPGANRPEPEILHGDADADIDEELAAFSTWEGFEVNLFASEREGLTSPLAIRWDPAGRAYVAVTTTYPTYFPVICPTTKSSCWKIRTPTALPTGLLCLRRGLTFRQGLSGARAVSMSARTPKFSFLMTRMMMEERTCAKSCWAVLAMVIPTRQSTRFSGVRMESCFSATGTVVNHAWKLRGVRAICLIPASIDFVHDACS